MLRKRGNSNAVRWAPSGPKASGRLAVRGQEHRNFNAFWIYFGG